MRAGQMGWQISMGDSQSLQMALYVRDAAGLDPLVDLRVPPLVPAVPRLDTSTFDHLDLAAGDWARWWTELLDEPSAFWIGPPDHGLADDSPLRPLVAACWEAAIRWPGLDHRAGLPAMAVDRRLAMLPNDVVHEVERELGRPARPFSLAVYVLPVAGREFWPLAADRVLASEGALRDPATQRALLEQFVGTLA